MTKEIIVPATSANMGPGFDSIGCAVNLYLKVQIGPASEEWHVDHPFGNKVADDASNLIVQSALNADPDIKSHIIEVKSEIPLTRGLGSSSSAIIAGLLLGKELSQKKISSEKLLDIAVEMEGHPDNAVPALLGGIVVGGKDPLEDDKFMTYKFKTPDDYLPVAIIPKRQLSTQLSRSVLPKYIGRNNAVSSSAASNLLVAALANQDWPTTFALTEKDGLHERYRQKLVPELETVRRSAHKEGIYGSYLSGAGTTIMTIVKERQADQLIEILKKQSELSDCQILKLSFDDQGARLAENEEAAF